MKKRNLVVLALLTGTLARLASAEVALDLRITDPAGQIKTMAEVDDLVWLHFALENGEAAPRYGLMPEIAIPDGLEIIGVESTPAAAAVVDGHGRIDWHLQSIGIGSETTHLDVLTRVAPSAAGRYLETTAAVGQKALGSAKLAVKSLATVDLVGDISVAERRNGGNIEVVFTMTVTNAGPEPSMPVLLTLDVDQGLLDEIEDSSRFEHGTDVECDRDLLVCGFMGLDVGQTRSVDAVLVFVPGDGGFSMTMAGVFESTDTDVDSSNNDVNLSYFLDRGDIRDEEEGGGGSAGWWLIGVLGICWLVARWRRR